MTGICSTGISYQVRIFQNHSLVIRILAKSMLPPLLDFVRVIKLGYPSLINSDSEF
jgi:hypothetical protein